LPVRQARPHPADHPAPAFLEVTHFPRWIMALLAVSALTPLLLITAMTATGRMPVATGAAVLGLIITVDGLLLLWFTRLKLIVQVHSGAVHVAARPAIFPGMVRTIPISQITQCAVQRASTARVGIQWTPGCWHATAGQKHVLVLTLARKRRWEIGTNQPEELLAAIASEGARAAGVPLPAPPQA
jgi:hypothetical protein